MKNIDFEIQKTNKRGIFGGGDAHKITASGMINEAVVSEMISLLFGFRCQPQGQHAECKTSLLNGLLKETGYELLLPKNREQNIFPNYIFKPQVVKI